MARRKLSFGDVPRGGWQSLTAADPLNSEGLRNPTDQRVNSRGSWQCLFSRPAKKHGLRPRQQIEQQMLEKKDA